jgi:sulfite reductase (NADPH) hemoprotein beta-component
MADAPYLPGRLGFADTADVDEFVDTLERYERGELTSEQWRAFRLLRGVYGQRQPDVQMLRVKIPQGLITAAQLRVLARVAERDGDGRCDVTTRQNLQFHNIRLADIERAMRDLADAGLTTREACGNSIRNVTACPLAGVDPAEVFDVTPYADAFTRYLLRGPLSSTLPRKFKVAFEGCHRGCVRAPINDLAFVARRSADGALGFQVLCAGGTATLARTGGELVSFLPADELLLISEAVLRVFHREGNRKNKHKARLKWVIEKIGFDAFRAQVLAERQLLLDAGAPALPFPGQAPPVEPPSARRSQASGGATAIPGSVARSLDYLLWRGSNVRTQKQTGFVSAYVTLPLGGLTTAQLLALAALAERHGDGSVRTTVDQNVVLRHIDEAAVPALYTALLGAGLGTAGAGELADVVSCPGADTCAIAVTTSRRMAGTLREHLLHAAREPGLDGARIYLSGCPNGCGQHHLGTFGLQGGLRKIGGRALPVYHLSIGGGVFNEGGSERARFGRLVGKLPARRGPQAVERLLALWRTERRSPEETLAQFYGRIEIEPVRAALADLLEIDEHSATEADFTDLGQQTAFVITDGESECAA